MPSLQFVDAQGLHKQYQFDGTADHCAAVLQTSAGPPGDVKNASMEAPSSNGKVPIIEVAFGNDTWWTLPMEISQLLHQKHVKGQNASFVWNWGGQRPGSWRGENGEPTSISRYVIDFVTKVQTNPDNKRRRTIRTAWVDPDDVEPSWTGEKSSLTQSMVQPTPMETDSALPTGKIPIIEIAGRGGKWWSMPQKKADVLWKKHMIGEGVGYIWGAKGYVIDFAAKCQKDIESNRLHSIRIAWVEHDDMNPSFTGQIVKD